MIGDHHCDAVFRNQPCRTGTHRWCRRIAEHDGYSLAVFVSLWVIAAARRLYREQETKPTLTAQRHAVFDNLARPGCIQPDRRPGFSR
jgi:hypothetical protein